MFYQELTDAEMLVAADVLYEGAYISALDNHPGVERSYAPVPYHDRFALLKIMYWCLGRVEQAWGHPVALVFYHMDIEGEHRARAFTEMLIGCFGDGYTIDSNYSAEFDRAKKVLGELSPAPFWAEDTKFREIAETVIEAKHGPFPEQE